jgi:branched-chain amino acid aminotransferase
MIHKFVWFDNEVMPVGMANISPLSVSARYGLTVFDTIRGYASKHKNKLLLFRVNDHINRLHNSALELELPLKLSNQDIKDAIFSTLEANECESDVYIRIDALVTENESWHSINATKLLISIHDNSTKISLDEKVKTANFSSWKRISNEQMPPSVKVGANYINSRYAFLESKRLKFDLPILLNIQGKVAESSGANIMIVKNKELVTPSCESQILDGITRNSLIHLAKKNNIKVQERQVMPMELLEADEVFFCGTSIEIAPVVCIDNQIIGSGMVGPMTRILNDLYFEAVRDLSSESEWISFR